MLNYLVERRGNDVFEDFFRGFNTNPIMKTDIKETDSSYLLDVELPGYKKDEVKISLDDGYLTISTVKHENKEDSNEKFIRKEIFKQSQTRSFYVGNIDQSKIDAKFENGILKIDVPKEELPKEETKYIEIK